MIKKDKMDKEERTTSIEKGLSQDIYTESSKQLMNAFVTGVFDVFDNMLADDVRFVEYGFRTLDGKAAVLSYLKEWREKYVETNRATCFEVVLSRYNSHACLKIGKLLLFMFRVRDEKIAEILYVSVKLARIWSDESMLNYPFDYERIWPYLTPDEGGKMNRIPCLSCGIESHELTWYKSKFPDKDGWANGQVSVCPKCGKVVEYKYMTYSPMEEKIDNYLIGSNYSDKGNAYSECGEKMYSKDLIGNLSKYMFSELAPAAATKPFVEHLETILTDVRLKEGFKFVLSLPSAGGSGDISRLFVVDKYGNLSAKSFTDNLFVRSTKMGAWQLYLLERLSTVLPFWWHGGYSRRTYVFKETDIDSIYPLKFHDLTELAEQDLLSPSVDCIKNDDGSYNLMVNCCFWNDWEGFVRERVVYTVKKGRVVKEEVEQNVLFEYDCGVCF